MATPRLLGTRLVVDLASAFQGWSDLSAVGVGLDGAVYAAARRSTEGLTDKRGIATFPKSTLQTLADYLVVRFRVDEVRTALIQSESIAVSYIQPHRDGILLVGARCHWRAQGAEKNAVVTDWTGRVLTRHTLGDGIQDVRVTADGEIWVSYFDEGVFGNYGWGAPGPEPIGAPGLVAFSRNGETASTYDPEAAQTDAVCDAYALNAADESDVWLYFYTQFPIVRILNGKYHVWNFGIGGARAIAVRDNRALLFGDYERRSLGRLVDLASNGTARVTDEIILADEKGEPLDGATAWGVGRNLYFLKDRRVLVAEDW